MTEIKVRESRPGDGAACARIWREVGAYFAELNPRTFQVPAAEGLTEWFEEIGGTIRAADNMLHLVAEVDGSVVGSLSATLHEPKDSAARQLQADLSRHQLHVDSIGITQAHRRGGVGSALMRAAEAWGRSMGAEVMVLEAEPNNPVSVPFYTRTMGFSVEAVVFRKEIAPG